MKILYIKNQKAEIIEKIYKEKSCKIISFQDIEKDLEEEKRKKEIEKLLQIAKKLKW